MSLKLHVPGLFTPAHGIKCFNNKKTKLQSRGLCVAAKGIKQKLLQTLLAYTQLEMGTSYAQHACRFCMHVWA